MCGTPIMIHCSLLVDIWAGIAFQTFNIAKLSEKQTFVLDFLNMPIAWWLHTRYHSEAATGGAL